ncbi:MAG: penicillin-binding protein 2 [Alphaproteobacteria bacterium]
MSTLTDNDRARLFTRRALLIGGMQMGFFALISGRLYHLQVQEATKYGTLAEENRVSQRLIPPPRGQILDRTGVPLAINQQNFRVIIDPYEADDVDTLLDKIGKYVPLDAADRKRIKQDITQRKSSNGALVQDNVTWDQVTAIELHRSDLPGAQIEPGEVRSYPFALATAHILGYVAAASEKDVARDPMLAIPGFRIGKSGIELQNDATLHGKVGHLQLEVDAHGQIVRELAHEIPRSGADLQLNIDIGLQQFTQQRLSKERSAAAVVMDIHNGAIYALASHPSFDPNLFTFGISQTDWDRLNNDPHTPMSNKAVSGMYAPGSTFKMVTALAGLEAGETDATRTTFCPGHYTLGGHKFHCWKREGHGTVNLESALAASCDIYFYDLAQRIGIDRIQAMAARLGLGKRTGIDLPHERGGFIPTRSWKLATFKESWQHGETLINGIGQGFMLTTPLQLAVMAARIANGGKSVLPHLVKDTPLPPQQALGIAKKNLELIRNAMISVVNKPIGTAYGERIKEPGMEMAGKTGTSQVRRISSNERATGVVKNENLPWLQRDHALFTGFAPLDKPQYAIGIIVEHGGSGAHVAAPVARDILLECQKRNPART